MRVRPASSPRSRTRHRHPGRGGAARRAPGRPVRGRGPAARRTYASPRSHRPACRPRAGRGRPGGENRTRACDRPGRRPTTGRGRARSSRPRARRPSRPRPGPTGSASAPSTPPSRQGLPSGTRTDHPSPAGARAASVRGADGPPAGRSRVRHGTAQQQRPGEGCRVHASRARAIHPRLVRLPSLIGDAAAAPLDFPDPRYIVFSKRRDMLCHSVLPWRSDPCLSRRGPSQSPGS